jgi:hypothetical protein
MAAGYHMADNIRRTLATQRAAAVPCSRGRVQSSAAAAISGLFSVSVPDMSSLSAVAASTLNSILARYASL